MLRICFILAALATLISTASAQPVLHLDQPRLTVDGTAYGVEGAPLQARPFKWLVVTVPGTGTYKVSTRPFRGMVRSGSFRGDQLRFVHQGRSIRLVSNGPLLRENGVPQTREYPAYVQYDRFGRISPFDTAHLALTYDGVADMGDRRLEAWGDALDQDIAAHRARYATLSPRLERLRDEQARLDAELDGFSTDAGSYSAARSRYLAAADRLDGMRSRLRTDRDRRDYDTQLRTLTDQVADLEIEYQRLLWVSDHLGDGLDRHERALYALRDDTAAMSAEANALADAHLRYVVARDRFNGIDVTMTGPRR